MSPRQSNQFLRALIGCGMVGSLGIVLLILDGCGKESPRPVVDFSGGSAVHPVSAAVRPEGRPEGYIGAEACGRCHAEQHKSWHRSFHRTMTQRPDGDRIYADFNGPVLSLGSEEFHLSMEGTNRWITIVDLDIPVGANGAAPPGIRVQPSLVTGSHQMQVFWVAGGNAGNAHVGFPFTWLNEEHRWVPRHGTFIRDPDADVTIEVWNGTCARCHSTGAQPGWDASAQLFKTRVADLGISCEACHGPGETHATHWKAEKEGGRTSLQPGKRDPTIVHPEHLAPLRASQICGYCHSMKWFDKSEPWSTTGFTYRPGDDLEKTTPVMRPTQINKQPWLKAAVDRYPALLDEFFWKDGMIRVSGREFNGLIESPCFQRGTGAKKLSCLSCHSMHKSDPDDQLGHAMEGNQACLQCHETLGADIPAHTRHAAGSAGSLCYNCHMPHTTYGVLKAIRSHQVSSPKVADELATGRPNACNLCHLDKPLSWTARHLQDWFKQPVPKMAPEQTDTAAGVLWTLKGDAGLRALTAWYFGWEPAKQAAGTNWIAPFLGQLLDDRYTAVRIIGGRSLKRLEGFETSVFDPVVPPEARLSMRDQLLSRWVSIRPSAEGSPALLGTPGGGFDTERFRMLLEQRDNRVVRLRE